MTPSAEFLITSARVMLIIAAICTTSFPVLYAFSPWRSTHLGKAVMIQAVAFTASLYLAILLRFWHPHDIRPLLIIQLVMFTSIAIATSGLTAVLWKLNYQSRNEETPHEYHYSKRTPKAPTE